MSKRTALRALLAMSALTSVVVLPGSAATAGATFTVSVGRLGTVGTVSSVPAGISCGVICQADFAAGTSVTLTATPWPNAVFLGWQGDCSGTGTCVLTMDANHFADAMFAPRFRPDGWIRLCGLSTGCTINPGPHPWRGNNTYNGTGAHQRVRVRIDNGEGVRFWIAIENDGRSADTIRVQGCRGTRRFTLNVVQLGLWKGPDRRAVKITGAFRRGTATFPFPPTTTEKRVFVTVNFIATTPLVGVSYRCPITVISEGLTTSRDTVVATMTTF